MAIGYGQVGLSDVRAELQLSSVANFSLNNAVAELYLALNAGSPTHPTTAGGYANDSLVSWRGYCHFCSVSCPISNYAAGFWVVNVGTTSGTITISFNNIHPGGVSVYYGWPYNSSGTLLGSPIYSGTGTSGITNATFTYTYSSTTLLYIFVSAAISAWSLSCPVPSGCYNYTLTTTGSTTFFYTVCGGSFTSITISSTTVVCSSTYPTTNAAYGTFTVTIGSTCTGGGGGSSSDMKLKENLVLIAVTEMGINVYRFNYISDPSRTYQGAIAQELIGTSHEDVLYLDDNGYYGVDYSRVDVPFMDVTDLV